MSNSNGVVVVKARLGRRGFREVIVVDKCPFCNGIHYHNLPLLDGKRLADCFCGEYVLKVEQAEEPSNAQ